MSLRYRPEIDGLRTIAVVSVLIYHAKFATPLGTLLPGGFLGVDIFFVISGFLITSLIVQEHDRTGAFSILNFYERRARRLLPALFLVIFASLPAAWAILLPSEMEEYVRSLLASVFFVSNMFWHSTLLTYGAGPGLLKPFLHTWSLAVEEQFYIFFPLFLVLVLNRAPARTGMVLAGGVALGLVVAEITTRTLPDLSFYWVVSRLWELLAGGCLAFVTIRHPGLGRTPAREKWGPTAGLALLAASLMLVQLNYGHPGLVTVPAVLGTVLIIWFATPADPVTRLLSSRLFVGIGLISYSLYLWHYPIFAFGRLWNPTHGLMDKAVWFALSFLGAWLSWRLVERPFRKPGRVPRKALLGSVLASVVVVAGFAAAMIAQDGRRERFPELIAIYGPAEFDNARLQEESWNVLADYAAAHGGDRSEAHMPSRFEREALWFDIDRPGRKVLVLGNSHGKDVFNALYLNAGRFPDMQVARFAMQANFPRNQIAQLLAAPNFEVADTVLIAFSYTNRSIRRMPRLLKALEGAGKKVVLLLSSPEFGTIEEREVFDWYVRAHHGLEDRDALDALGYDTLRMKSKNAWDADLIPLAEARGIPMLDRRDYVCDAAGERCEMSTPEGRKTFFDQHHYTRAGAEHFGQRIAETGWLKLP